MTIQIALDQHYASLSPSQQKIARYIDEHCEDIVFLSINELATKLDASPATIVRFARALGFAGYADMQKSIRGMVTVVKQKQEAGDLLSGYTEAAAQSCETLRHMFHSMDPEQVARIATAMMTAKDVLIIGYMDSFGTAAELVNRLYGMRSRVHFSRLINDWDHILDLMTPDTLVIAVSFAPHYQYTYTCVTTAKERGCRVLLLTDSAINPMADCAAETLVFPAFTQRQGHPQRAAGCKPCVCLYPPAVLLCSGAVSRKDGRRIPA